MTKFTLEDLAESIGYDIGCSNDVTQSILLNAFFKGLHNSILEQHNRELQLCYVTEKLSKTSEEGIRILYELIKIKNEGYDVYI